MTYLKEKQGIIPMIVFAEEIQDEIENLFDEKINVVVVKDISSYKIAQETSY